MDLKSKINHLHQLTKSTLGARPSLLMLKNGFTVKIERSKPADDYRTPVSQDCEEAIDQAIEYIESRSRKITHNDIHGSNTSARYSIEKELSL